MADARMDLDAADELEGIAAGSLAAGVADVTRGTDATVVAGRVARLSSVVAAAGARDVAQGAELLAVSSDVEAMSAAVGVMAAADLEQGMLLGRLAGELRVVAALVSRMEMPVLAAFLASRSTTLTRTGVEAVVRASGGRALGTALAVTGGQIEDLSEEEVAEGVVRLAAADAGSMMSEALAEAGAESIARGAEELAGAEIAAEAARRAEAEGIAETAAAGAELGAAAADADNASRGV